MLYNGHQHHPPSYSKAEQGNFSDIMSPSHRMIVYTLEFISPAVQSSVLSMLRLHFLALSLSVCCFTPGIWWDLCVAGGDQYYSRYNQPQVLELPSPTRKAGIFIFRRSYTSSS